MRQEAHEPRTHSSVRVPGATTTETTQDDPESQMRPLSKPRRRLVLERPQTLLPLEGLPVRVLPAGGGTAARDGGAGRTEEATGGGGDEGTRPG